MKLIYNAVKESKVAPRYPEIVGTFEQNVDAVAMIKGERLKMENTKFNFYVQTIKSNPDNS